jgi:uncharacterized protein (DUF4415 family)
VFITHAKPETELGQAGAVMNELYAWAQKSPTKQLVSLRLDRDVLAHFRSSGRGRQGAHQCGPEQGAEREAA